MHERTSDREVPDRYGEYRDDHGALYDDGHAPEASQRLHSDREAQAEEGQHQRQHEEARDATSQWQSYLIETCGIRCDGSYRLERRTRELHVADGVRGHESPEIELVGRAIHQETRALTQRIARRRRRPQSLHRLDRRLLV